MRYMYIGFCRKTGRNIFSREAEQLWGLARFASFSDDVKERRRGARAEEERVELHDGCWAVNS